MSDEHEQHHAHHTSGDDSEKAFERQLQALARQTKSMTGKVTKVDTNLYRVEGPGAAITRFDLQGSQSWAGQGNKQSSTRASGYVTTSEATLLQSRATNGANATVTYQEAANQIDLLNIHAS
jgi:hypothetical protein